MTEEIRKATAQIDASVETVFALLADPARHAGVEGTGWVGDPVDGGVLTAVGQVFRMGMRSPGDGGAYVTANQVDVFEENRSIGWGTGGIDAQGEVWLGGWTWRYDLEPVGGGRCSVTLTYDWSGVGETWRQRIAFPPFEEGYLESSLGHLSALASG